MCIRDSFTPAGQVEKVHVDVVIPVLHGLWGEDGTVQGLSLIHIWTPIPCRRWTQPLRPCPQSLPATIWWPRALLFLSLIHI